MEKISDILRLIRRFLVSTSSAPKPLERNELERGSINQSLKQLDNWNSGVSRIPMDGVYYAPNKNDVDDVVADYFKLLPYESDKWDCENYSMFQASLVSINHGINTVGIVIDWSAEPAHAYNIIIDDEGNLYIYEPQPSRFDLLDNNPFPASELPKGDKYIMDRAKIII